MIVVAAALVGCLPEDETADTLDTLVPPVVAPTSPDVETRRTPATTESAATTTTAAIVSPTATRQLPVGDWTRGVRYDIGVVRRVTSLQGQPAIAFDRYSYAHPAQGVIDAEQLDAEPIEYWYSSSPFFNVNQQVRTFVLAPDVEVLVLDDDGRAAACSSSRTAAFPEPNWQTVDTSSLDQLAGTRRLASLTYSSQGVVERIRFTSSC